MKDLLRPILELTVVFPGLLLAYFPVRSYLKQPPARLAAWAVPLLFGLCLGGGLLCYCFNSPTALPLLVITLAASLLYVKTLQTSLWKSGTIALAVCAVFACLNSLSRAIGTAITLRQQLPPDKPWFCFAACIFYNAVCWLITAAAYYPATHAVRMMVEDDNFAQTWYAFWVLPLVFILLNLFMIPRYPTTLQTGRVLQVYIVMSIALLFLMLFFNAIFLLMAISINRNARLQQENQFLSMQQQRYESLKAAIEEARQARHDMRHQMNQLSALAEAGDLDGLKAYLAKTVSRIPELDMSFSGLKTAVVNLTHNAQQKGEPLDAAALARDFTQAVSDELVPRAMEAARRTGRRTIVAAGGVAANSIIRGDLERACRQAGCRLYLPPLCLCGDNGAMIGAQGYYEYLAGHTADLSLNAYATRDLDRG